MTTLLLCTRVNEPRNYTGEEAAVRSHTENCMGRGPTIEDFVILKKLERDIMYLSVMEALFIREIRPELNTGDEFRGRELRIKNKDWILGANENLGVLFCLNNV